MKGGWHREIGRGSGKQGHCRQEKKNAQVEIRLLLKGEFHQYAGWTSLMVCPTDSLSVGQAQNRLVRSLFGRGVVVDSTPSPLLDTLICYCADYFPFYVYMNHIHSGMYIHLSYHPIHVQRCPPQPPHHQSPVPKWRHRLPSSFLLITGRPSSRSIRRLIQGVAEGVAYLLP